MDDFKKLADEFGLQMDDIGLPEEPLKNLSRGFYKHPTGDYAGLVGKSKIQFLDREKKKVERGTAGAVAGYGGLQLIILKNPEGTLIDNTFKLPPDTDYSKFIYNIYLPLELDRQWQNVRSFAAFTFNGHPEFDIISGKQSEEEVNLTKLQLFYGYPVTFTIIEGKKEGSRFIENYSLQLIDHELEKAKVASRKTVTDSIYTQLDILLAESRAKREANSNGGTDATPSSAESPDSFLPDFNV